MLLTELFLNEATLDLSHASAEKFGDIGYEFTIPVNGGGHLQIGATVILGRTVIITDIIPVDVTQHDDAFDDDPNVKRIYGSGVNLGTKEVKHLLRYVLDRIRQDYPNIKMIGGERVTGARGPKADRLVTMAI